ncbi:MAG TPA: hypothetical protein VHC97_20300 [Thermoanaerobaculia bacterium]|nr:hypothetical protein [Thermoanaerobaculia bacterium]
MMSPRNTRVIVFATALLTAPLLPAWAQAPHHPRPPQQKEKPKEPQVIIKETPIEEGDPQAQGTTQGTQQGTTGTQTQGTQDPAMAPQDPNAPQQGTAQPGTQDPNAAQGQPGTAPGAPGTGAKTVTPEQIGISFAPPQGWQQGDPTKFTLPGDICCAWSPDNVASIVAFVQKTGKPLNPKVLLDQSAQALQTGVGAQVKTKELQTIGGKRGFSLVVTAPGNGAAIDGKGTVPTTQHWVAVPREQDVIIFLMTTPDASFAQNEQIFQSMLSSLKVSGNQTPEQMQASR